MIAVPLASPTSTVTTPLTNDGMEDQAEGVLRFDHGQQHGVLDSGERAGNNTCNDGCRQHRGGVTELGLESPGDNQGGYWESV